jgi:hypothetical protein
MLSKVAFDNLLQVCKFFLAQPLARAENILPAQQPGVYSATP